MPALTYAAGFFTPDAVYLTADTAASSKSVLSVHDDTFFAQPAKQEGFELCDNVMKQFQISRHCIVASAGDSYEIHKSIGFLRDNWSQSASIQELFDRLNSALINDSGQVILIVALSTDAVLRMGIWQKGRDYSWAVDNQGVPATSLCTGSGRVFSNLTEVVGKSLRLATKNTVHNNITFINSCHQLHAEHFFQEKHRVGGAFITAAMTLNGVVWQKDTAYYRYSPVLLKAARKGEAKMKGFYPVVVLVREGVVFVERRVPRFRQVKMGNAVPVQVYERVCRDFDQEVADRARLLDTDYGVFLSREYPYGVVVDHISPDYCYKNTIGESNAEIRFSPDFYETLLDTPKIDRNGLIRIRMWPDGMLKPDYHQKATKIRAALVDQAQSKS